MPTPLPSVDEQVNAAAQMAQGGRLEQAAQAIEAALREDPRHAEGNRVMALILMNAGQMRQALMHIERAIQAAPNRADLHATLGSMMYSVGQRDQAIDILRHSLALNRGMAPVHGLLATLLLERKDYDGAEDHYREAMAIAPHFAEARTNLASVLESTARQDEAIALLREGATRHPNHPGLLINYSVALNYADGVAPDEIRAAHHQYGKVLMGLPGQIHTQWPNPKDPERRLRIGLVSPDFFEHSVAYFARPIVEGLDRKHFQVFLYSTGGRPDTMTARLQRAADTWRDVARTNDQQFLDAIRADQIDILVELSGQTLGNRLMALRRRGAPVQVTYCGYPNTTGVPTIDYRIVDSTTDPVGGPGAEAMAVERLIRIDPCFLCYSPPDEGAFHSGWFNPGAATSPPPARDFVTFGSFNAIKKVTPNVLKVWSRLLHEVPRARLVLKSQGLESARARRPILDVLKAQGIAEVRVDLWEKIEGKQDHLSAYEAMDIGLDTFPYNGTTTTCEAMWMGVPVVSLVGNLHASRVGLTLLNSVGLTDLAATNEDQYIRTAAALANDPARLANLKSTLRQRMLTSPLMNRSAFVTRFADALRTMWRTWCR